MRRRTQAFSHRIDRMIVPRIVGQPEPVARTIGCDRPAALELHRVGRQMLVVSETRTPASPASGKRGGEMHARVRGKRVCRATRECRAHPPATPPASRRRIFPCTFMISTARARDQPPLARQIEILAGVEMRERHRLGHLPQSLEIVAQARILNPEDVVPSVTETGAAAGSPPSASKPRWRRS